MPIVNIEPTTHYPLPFDTDDEVASTFAEEVAVAANTVEMQFALGASLDVDEATAGQEKTLIDQALKNRKSKNLTNPNTAFAAAAFLRTYGQQIALDAAQARSAITHKLMELANCGDPRYELKALELLGKHSDIGLFTERSEITINYKTPEDLEQAIKERVKRLLNADVIDVTPIGADLDEQLGVAGAPEYRSELMDELDELDGTSNEAEDGDDDHRTTSA
jgi:exopolyphosphatase/pppGpp-phosphohydrolase